MSPSVILNYILGAGYLLQAAFVFTILFQYHKASPIQYLKMASRKSLMTEFLFVVMVISLTVSVQNFFEFDKIVDKIIFIWRIVFNCWSTTIFFRMFLYNKRILRKSH